jgi:hypothetical protein
MIDVHTHHLLPEHWGEEFECNWRPVYGQSWPCQTPADFDDAMVGVDCAIVFGITATRVGLRTPHKVVVDFCAETKRPTIGFMALDLTDRDVFDQLEDGCEVGLRGIKLYPVLAGFSPADAQYESFFQVVEERGIPVLWHMGTTPSPAGRLALTLPVLIDEVAHRHPELRQIIAHMGHPWQRDTVVVLRKNRNVFADISGLWARPFDGYLALVCAQEWGVVDKLLFGSDYPLWTPAEAVTGLHKVSALSAGTFPKVKAESEP